MTEKGMLPRPLSYKKNLQAYLNILIFPNIIQVIIDGHHKNLIQMREKGEKSPVTPSPIPKYSLNFDLGV